MAKKRTLLLLLIASPLVLILIVVAAKVTHVWVTTPPEVDPAALPSSLLEPPSAEYEAAVEEGRAIARSLVAEEKLPGLSLAVAVDGEIVWAEGFGLAHLKNETPVTPATRFRIGGISQTLTSAAVGLLSDRGRLDLDEPVQRYVPSFPQKEWPISARQLMAHTSGIRPHRGDGGIFYGPGCADDADRLAIFADDPLHFRPGTESRYSTYGWALVGAMIAGAADEPYLSFMQRGLFSPLGMEETAPDIDGKSENGSTHFYYPRVMLNPRYGLQDAPLVDLSCYLPAVGFLSTPSDLVRFGSAMMTDELLDPATIDALQQPQPLATGALTEQALGWTVRTEIMGTDGELVRIVGQGLDVPVRRSPLSAVTVGVQVSGGTASLLTVPEHAVAIAVATNVTGAENVSVLANRLAGTFVGVRKQRRLTESN